MRGVFFLVLAFFWTSLAYAQKAESNDPDTEIARRHYAAGKAYYEKKDYQNALLEFEAARIAKALPAFDFNIGRCFDRLEQHAEAIEAYERYVASQPPPPDVDEVRTRIKVL